MKALATRCAAARQALLNKVLYNRDKQVPPFSLSKPTTHKVDSACDVKFRAEARNPKWSAEDQTLIDCVLKNFNLLSSNKNVTKPLLNSIQNTLDQGPRLALALPGEFQKSLQFLKQVIDDVLEKRLDAQISTETKEAKSNHVVVDCDINKTLASDDTSTWSVEDEKLIRWFSHLSDEQLPKLPFKLHSHMVVFGDKFYTQLGNGISRGAKGPRALTGALQEDIRILKMLMEEKLVKTKANVRQDDILDIEKVDNIYQLENVEAHKGDIE